MKPRTAREKTMDYLAVRTHSRSELQAKLEEKQYSPLDIMDALDKAEKAGWIPEASAHAQQIADDLHAKNKSHAFILKTLESKGLPPVSYSLEREIQKAQNLLESSFSKLSKSSETDKKKKVHFLKNRGFDIETLHVVISHFDELTGDFL